MTHRDSFLWLSVRSAWRSDTGYRKPRATQPESHRKLSFRLSSRTFGGRRKALPIRRIADGSSPTRRSPKIIPMGHKSSSLV